MEENPLEDNYESFLLMNWSFEAQNQNLSHALHHIQQHLYKLDYLLTDILYKYYHWYTHKRFQKESDLLKVYREADALAKYLNDTDEKLLGYHKVIDFCLSSEKCLENKSVKKTLFILIPPKDILEKI